MVFGSKLFDQLKEQVNQALQTPWLHCTDQAIAAARLDQFSAPTISMLGGGKRFRALGVGAGYLCGAEVEDDQWPQALVDLATALELFQASALVHDDIIDEALTRRSLPTAHVAFTNANPKWGQRFGVSAAILWGDLLASAGQSFFYRCLQQVQPAVAPALARQFGVMQSEVAYGQFLDLSAECSELSLRTPPRLEDAIEVVRHKTARYSVVHPLVLGARLARADEEWLEELAKFAEPLGIAFQLRDDDLGIFGDPAITGKPAGDDIREGKRTVQLTLAWQMTDDDGRDYLMRYWGAPDVNEDVLANIRSLIEGSGARAALERMIHEYLEQVQAGLAQLRVPAASFDTLSEFAHSVAYRNY